ncbi:MAG TPA: EAL domain-containing protein [Xanthomonadales bacterium]|nr:EAL domain-containing protein [Xanthomonadales bacterium]
MPASGWEWRARPWTLAGCVVAGALLVAEAVMADVPERALRFALYARAPLLLAAVWFGWRAARANAANPRTRLSWLWVTAGFAVLLPGDIAFALELAASKEAPATVADVFYLGYFVLILGGLLSFPRVFRNRSDAAMFALDAGIVAIGGGMVLWHFGVEPVIDAAEGSITATLLLDLAYPLGDLLTLLGIATVLLRLPRGPRRLSLLLLALPFVLSLAGDTVWMVSQTNVEGRLLAQALWLLQPIAFVAAAEQEARRPREAREDETLAWQPAFGLLPYLGLLLGYAVLAQAAYGERTPRVQGLLPGAIALTLLVVARQALAQRENRALLAEAVRRADERRFAALVRNASDVIFIVDSAMRVSYASPAAEQLVHAGPASLLDVVHPDDRTALRDYVAACVRGQARHAALDLRFGSPTGSWVATETRLTNLLTDPEVRGIVLNARDVSERRQLEEQLRAQALTDTLTSLPNRALFMDRVARAFARDGGRGIAVAVLDLDHFTQVNDGLGHRIGDQVLATVAARIASGLSGADSAARIGGDDFGLLFEGVAGEDLLRARVERVRSAVAQPLRAEGHAVRLTASVGVALGQGAGSTEGMLRNADIALMHVRTEGGDGVELFRSDRHGRVVERLALEAQLPKLLEANAFTVVFEPVVHLASGRPTGIYVRLDWRTPNPDLSIAAVEAAARESAASATLGRWVRQAMQKDLSSLLRYLPDAGELGVGLRLEAPQLRDELLCDEIAALVTRLELPPRNLVLELPASALTPMTGQLAHTLQRLRELGVSLGLGEFGAVHASFELLDAFRFDGLVLAEALVERVDAGPRPGALVRGAIATGRSLEMRVVAPNVRTQRQRQLLGELGCEFAFGPAVAPAMGYEHLLPFLAARFAEAREATRS